MKRIAILFCLTILSLCASADINRSFFGVSLGMTKEKVKNIMMADYQAYDNEESISFPTNYSGNRVYVTMYFDKNVFYKIEIVGDDSSPKFRTFNGWNKRVIQRYYKYEPKEVETPTYPANGSEIFRKGMEVTDGKTNCCLYLEFSQDAIRKETNYRTHLIYQDATQP